MGWADLTFPPLSNEDMELRRGSNRRRPISARGQGLTTHQRMAMIDQELLAILVCPESKEEVQLADKALLEQINKAIAKGGLKNRGGDKIEEAIDGGLLRKDGKYLYPIRDEIPIMLVEEAIPLPLEK